MIQHVHRNQRHKRIGQLDPVTLLKLPPIIIEYPPLGIGLDCKSIFPQFDESERGGGVEGSKRSGMDGIEWCRKW